jgi:Kdo2-lipid IVA lauroyltransferase/acyltransferase
MPQWVYNLRNLPSHLLIKVLILLVRVLPAPAAYAMGRGLTLFAWHTMPRWRHTATRNLELMFGERYSPEQRLAIGRESAISLGYYSIELIQMGIHPKEDGLAMVVEAEGLEHYHAALEQGRGVIGLAMHCGNWDLSGAYLHNNVRTLYAVGKEQRDDFFTKLLFPWRAKYGMHNIFSGKHGSSAILRALKSNCILGLLADQNGGSTGTFAPLAGRLASTVPGPAALALKTGAALIVTYTRRLGPGRHRFVAKAPLDVSGLPEDKQAAQVELLGRINQAYWDVLAEDPTQWLWGHKRFKTRPPGEPWLY